MKITSRAGALFFIRVKGPIKEQASLKSFDADKPWYKALPVSFRTVIENTGTVREQPAGTIEVKNMLGKVVGTVEIQPFNVLRDSLRSIVHTWEAKGLQIPGRYSATLKLNLGYGNNTETMTVTFWYMPQKEISMALGALLVLIIILYILKKNIHIELKKKKKKE